MDSELSGLEEKLAQLVQRLNALRDRRGGENRLDPSHPIIAHPTPPVAASLANGRDRRQVAALLTARARHQSATILDN